jgi:REP element-mobilizing transposase RayT
MARPLRVEFPGALYLVSARAIPRQRLFRDEEEAADFSGRLPQLVETFGAVFHGFCLLPNHYHLLVETPRGNLTRIVHRLNSGYTASVNTRRQRKGPLLQTRYRSILLEEDPWLLRLSVHVHLNPVRKKLAGDAWSYPASSARAFGPLGPEIPGLATGKVLSLAGGPEAYARLLDDALQTPPPAPWKEVWRQSVLGGDGLRRRVLAALEGRDIREIAGFTPERGGVELPEVVRLVAENTGVGEREILRSKFQRVLARKLAIHLARRFTGLTLRQIGEVFGVDYTTIHMASRRVEELRRDDPGVEELLRALEGELSARTAPPPESPAKSEVEPKRKPPKKERAPKRETPQLKLF